jgi:hypothetical protein
MMVRKGGEYRLYALVMNIPNNDVAENYYMTKTPRSIDKNPSSLNRNV